MVSTSLSNSSSFNKHHVAAATFLQNISDSTPQKAAINAIQDLGLRIAIYGSWVWVFGANPSHQSQLKAANFWWSYKRGAWYFYPTESEPKAQS